MLPDNSVRESMIQNYLMGYNQFDINQMIQDLDDNILFENIQDGQVTLSLTGIEAFKKQAEQAVTYFSQRTQTIKTIKFLGEVATIEIDYTAVLSQDLPNGLKYGQKLELSGKTLFYFSENRVTKITDIS